MERLLRGNIWKQAHEIFSSRTGKVACIAYVTRDTLDLSTGDVLICDASDYAIRVGQTAARVLLRYKKKGVRIFSNDRLHAKLLLAPDVLPAGSANLSKNSAEALVEIAVLTSDRTVLKQATLFFHELLKRSDEFSASDIARLLDLKVERRPPKNFSRTSKIGTGKPGSGYWFLPTVPAMAEEVRKTERLVQDDAELIARETGHDPLQIHCLHGDTGDRFGKSASKGDEIAMRTYASRERRQSSVSPPVLVLKRRAVGNKVYVYYCELDQKEALPWTRFAQKAGKLKLGKTFGSRSRALSQEKMDQLRTSCWI